MRQIGGIMGRSPFGPLHEHMLKARECAELLEPLMEAFLAEKYEEVDSISERIFRLESEADAIKTEIRSMLSTSIFSAVEHTEVLNLLKTQDDVADDSEDAARLLSVRRTSVTDALGKALAQLVAKVWETVRLLAEITELVQELDDTGKREAIDRVHAVGEELRTAREQSSDLAHAALRRVFADEETIGPVSVVLLMQLTRTLSAVSHSAENASDAVVRMVSGK